uniref:Uncharacterized protein n=1 Tax=Ditylenchus dipsaci TaxID=166011 RepID=A0A915EA69_9BILA
MEPSTYSNLNGSYSSCYADYEANDVRVENEYPDSANQGRQYLASQVKLLRVKLNHEKLHSRKQYDDLQNHYRGRITELEGRLLRVSEIRPLRDDVFEAEKAKLENEKTELRNQIENLEYELEQCEERASAVNQQLHAKELAKTKSEEELSALKIKMKELSESDKRKVDEQLSQLQDFTTKNKQLEKLVEEMEEKCKKNSEIQKTLKDKYQQRKAKMAKTVAEHQKEIEKIKVEAREKYLQELAKCKDDSLLYKEKHHTEVVELKEKLMRLDDKYRNQLGQSNQIDNELTKVKEELSRVNALYQNQLAEAQVQHQESESSREAQKRTGCCRRKSAEVRAQHLKQLVDAKSEADEAIRKHKLESHNARKEASDFKKKLEEINERCKTAENKADKVQQGQQKHLQQLQTAPAERRGASPVPLPPLHATNEIAVITLSETPPRPSTPIDHAGDITIVRTVIKKHLLHQKSTNQQQEPAKKHACQRSPARQQQSGNQSAGGAPPLAKKVSQEVDKNNLSQYFEENPRIDKDEKKRYVLNVLANAGFTMTPSPQKAVNDNAIVATTSFSPTTADAVCPKPQPQQRPKRISMIRDSVSNAGSDKKQDRKQKKRLLVEKKNHAKLFRRMPLRKHKKPYRF